MKIYIDFDDVICETAIAFLDLARKLFGIDLSYDDFHFFNMQKTFGLDDDQYKLFLKEGHTEEEIIGYEETLGASTTINKWIDEGHDVYVITGRPFDCYDISRKWLDDHGLDRVPLYCVDKYGRENFTLECSYGLTLEELYEMNFDFAVEDSPVAYKHLLHFKKCTVAVFNRPWNIDEDVPNDHFIRCNGWQEVSALLSNL